MQAQPRPVVPAPLGGIAPTVFPGAAPQFAPAAIGTQGVLNGQGGLAVSGGASLQGGGYTNNAGGNGWGGNGYGNGYGYNGWNPAWGPQPQDPSAVPGQQAPATRPYSAVAIHAFPGQPETSGSIVKSGQNMRLEFDQNGAHVIQILRPADGVMYILNPATRTCVEKRGPSVPAPASDGYT